MAQCGIKKYDRLPGRVGFIDVDAARAALNYNLKTIKPLTQLLDKAVYLEKIKKEKEKNGKRL